MAVSLSHTQKKKYSQFIKLALRQKSAQEVYIHCLPLFS